MRRGKRKINLKNSLKLDDEGFKTKKDDWNSDLQFVVVLITGCGEVNK